MYFRFHCALPTFLSLAIPFWFSQCEPHPMRERHFAFARNWPSYSNITPNPHHPPPKIPYLYIMSQLNANTPYVQSYIRNKYIMGSDGLTEGYIFGVKSMLNRPLHFHFQASFGAVFWNMPISAFVHLEEYDILSDNEQERLSLLQTWDCQSNNIAVTTFAFLQNKRVDVFCRDKQWRSGTYAFTIDDYEGDLNELNVGYSNDQDSKCYHFIVLEDGNFCVQPNNLCRWHNPDFIVPYPKDNPPKLRIFKEQLTSEDIDRSYGNSPYYFYTQH